MYPLPAAVTVTAVTAPPLIVAVAVAATGVPFSPVFLSILTVGTAV